MKIIHVNISSFIGVSIGAMHYYAKIIWYDEDDERFQVRLDHKLTQAQAIELNKIEWEKYGGLATKVKPGDLVEGFWTEKGAEDAAIKYFKQHFSKDYDLLLEGSSCCASVQQCLYHKDVKIKNKINKLYKRADEIDFYNHTKYEDEMEKIDDAFTAIIK